MNDNALSSANIEASFKKACDYFANKLAVETDCSDVYQAITSGNNSFVFIDTRSPEAFAKSYAITAINKPTKTITNQWLSSFDKSTQFVVYCWGPGCNGATKAAKIIAENGYGVKEMIGGIHYWEDFERYPVVRGTITEQQ